MQSLRRIKERIRSIGNTKKVTGAMEMVSFTKLNRIDDLLYAVRTYFLKMDSFLNNLTGSMENISHPFFQKRTGLDSGKIVLSLVTSDNGLCGVYNNNIIHLAEEFISRYDKDKLKLVIIGRKGFTYFKTRGYRIENAYLGLNGRYSDNLLDEIVKVLTGMFSTREADEIYLAYTYFKNTLVHPPLIKKILSIDKGINRGVSYIFDPDIDRILEELVPKYIKTKMKLMLLEAFTSEHAARVVSMKAATDNAKELLEKLTLVRNKVRQANITREIMEIVSSSEALRG